MKQNGKHTLAELQDIMEVQPSQALVALRDQSVASFHNSPRSDSVGHISRHLPPPPTRSANGLPRRDVQRPKKARTEGAVTWCDDWGHNIDHSDNDGVAVVLVAVVGIASMKLHLIRPLLLKSCDC